MADTVRNFAIMTPRGVAYTVHGENGKTTCRLEWNHLFPRGMGEKFGKAQKYVDQECIRRMERDTPFRSGTLRRAAATGTVIGSGVIRQATPYARRQYYEHKENSKWFERMANRDKDVILEGAMRIAAGD